MPAASADLGERGGLHRQHRLPPAVLHRGAAAVFDEHFLLDVADHPAGERSRQRRRTLDRGRSANHGLDLGIAERRGGCRLAVRSRRVRDVAPVGRRPRPLISRGVRRVAGRSPQRERVVGEVVVQIDQPRIDRRPRGHPPRVRVAGRCAPSRRLDRLDDSVVVHVHGARAQHAAVIVERDDGPGEHERGHENTCRRLKEVGPSSWGC